MLARIRTDRNQHFTKDVDDDRVDGYGGKNLVGHDEKILVEFLVEVRVRGENVRGV